MISITKIYRAIAALFSRPPAVPVADGALLARVPVRLREEYAAIWRDLRVLPSRLGEARKAVASILQNRAAYELIEKDTGCPWWVTALIHYREASLKFNCHLANGDPLSARTKHHPAGLPKTGKPPFTFHQGAVAALQYDALDVRPASGAAWPVEYALWGMHRFNGIYAVPGGGHSPYLVSGSNLATAGKFVADHRYDPAAIDKQLGVATLLRVMVDDGHLHF